MNGLCWDCGAEAGSNPGCGACAQWSRLLALPRRGGGKCPKSKVQSPKSRKPRRLGPVVVVGCQQLPPSDRE